MSYLLALTLTVALLAAFVVVGVAAATAVVNGVLVVQHAARRVKEGTRRGEI